MKPTPLYVLTAVLLAGCAGAPMPGSTAANAAGTMSIKGMIKPAAGKNFALKGLVTPNDIAHLDEGRIEVWLTRDDGEPALLGELPGTQRTLALNNLKLSSSYAVTLRAFKDDPNTPEPDKSLQMSDDAASTVTFDTMPDENGAFATMREVTFAIKLLDYTFAGEGSGEISVTEGVLDSTEETEALVPPPAGGEGGGEAPPPPDDELPPPPDGEEPPPDGEEPPPPPPEDEMPPEILPPPPS